MRPQMFGNLVIFCGPSWLRLAELGEEEREEESGRIKRLLFLPPFGNRESKGNGA